MNQVRAALDQVLDILLRGLAWLLYGIGFIENWLRGFLQQLGLPQNVQTVVLIVAALALFAVALKLLGGFFRVLVILFLVLLVVQFFGVLSNGPRRLGMGGAALVLPG